MRLSSLHMVGAVGLVLSTVRCFSKGSMKTLNPGGRIIVIATTTLIAVAMAHQIPLVLHQIQLTRTPMSKIQSRKQILWD